MLYKLTTTSRKYGIKWMKWTLVATIKTNKIIYISTQPSRFGDRRHVVVCVFAWQIARSGCGVCAVCTVFHTLRWRFDSSKSRVHIHSMYDVVIVQFQMESERSVCVCVFVSVGWMSSCTTRFNHKYTQKHRQLQNTLKWMLSWSTNSGMLWSEWPY